MGYAFMPDSAAQLTQGDAKPTQGDAQLTRVDAKPTTAQVTEAVHQVLQSQDIRTFSMAQLLQTLGALIVGTSGNTIHHHRAQLGPMFPGFDLTTIKRDIKAIAIAWVEAHPFRGAEQDAPINGGEAGSDVVMMDQEVEMKDEPVAEIDDPSPADQPVDDPANEPRAMDTTVDEPAAAQPHAAERESANAERPVEQQVVVEQTLDPPVPEPAPTAASEVPAAPGADTVPPSGPVQPACESKDTMQAPSSSLDLPPLF